MRGWNGWWTSCSSEGSKLLIDCQTLDRAGLAPRCCCPVCHYLADVGGLRTLSPEGRSHVVVKVCCERHRALQSRYDDSADGMSRQAWARLLLDIKAGLEAEP